MTAAFEVAAGAFAVIGLADVAVRTGREVYEFLHDVADAPNEMDRLCNSVRETTQLAEISKECLDKLSNQPTTAYGAIDALNSSLRSLNRELQSLKVLSSKCRGQNPGWSRVKYVLDKRKIGKSLDSIERSKTLLAGALVVVCRELSAIDHESTNSLVQHCFAQLGLETDSLTRTLSATLQQNHQEVLQKHKAQEKASLIAEQTQAQIVTTVTRLRTQNAHISKAMRKTREKITEEHEKTRDIICATLDDIISTKMEALSKPLSRKPRALSPSNRNIYFFGERRDMILVYLLLAKAQLETAICHLLSCTGEKVSAQHVEWLRSEFKNLVASAAHEEASSHFGSTHIAPDRWFYSDEISRPPTNSNKPSLEELLGSTHDTRAGSEVNAPMRTHLNDSQQSPTNVTPLGNFRLQIPPSAEPHEDAQSAEEVGFSYTCGIGQSVHAISVRFFSQIIYGSSPRLCAQLNVFTIAESDDQYPRLFAKGTVEEIDAALRQGIISPYHISREGRNMCLYFAAEYARMDLFNYLNSQGIGVSNLRHDSSVVAGFFKRSTLNSDRPKLESSVDYVLNQVYDSSFFLTEMTMGMLLWDYYMGRPRSLFREHLQRLQKEDLIEHPVPISATCDTTPWDWDSVSSIIRPLFATGTYIYTTGSLGRNPIQRTFGVLVDEDDVGVGDPMALEEILNGFIRAGVDIHHRDNDGLTPSMYARRHGHWHEWCRALERNGRCIGDVLVEERAEWLIGEDWRVAWREKYGTL